MINLQSIAQRVTLFLAAALAVAACTVEGPDTRSPHIASLATTDGTTLVYQAHGQGDIAVVMIHGWGGSRDSWQLQIEPLVEAGYRVVTVDLPGHGEAASEREPWRVAAYAEDIQSMIAHLDLDQVVLVGHSMGGPVALLTAPRVEPRAIAVICVDTLHDVEFEWPAEMTRQMVSGLEQNYERAMNTFFDRMFPPQADPDVIDQVKTTAMTADRQALIGLMGDFATLDTSMIMAAASVPVRCINARAQSDFGMNTNIEVNQRHADFDAVLIDGVGHFPHLEAPEAFNRELLVLLEELTAPD